MGQLCYSLGKATVNNCNFMVHTRGDQAVELRLDLCELEEDDIKEIFSRRRTTTLIAACHAGLPSEYDKVSESLITAILAGADYVDIDLFFPRARREFLMNLAFTKGCKVILSYHNYSDTESLEHLLEIAKTAEQCGADIIKIVTTAHTDRDCATVLSLYEHFEARKLVAFAMGDEGYATRLISFEKGAPFFYLSTTREGRTATGQPTSFDFVRPKDIILKGEAVLPASKSFAQRAILLAALATGSTKLYGITLCDDVRAAIGVAQTLYADVSLEGEVLTVTGRQNIREEGLKVRGNRFFVGESAFLARLLIPLAGLSGERITIEGEKTLLRRKIDDHKIGLRKLGLKVSYTDRAYLPVTVEGRLRSGGYHVLSGMKSSQMISGLLIALSLCPENTILEVERITSEPYVELTAYVASFFGIDGISIEDGRDVFPDDDAAVDILAENDLDDIPADMVFNIEGSRIAKPVIGIELEKDWSSAAMLMAAAAIAGNVTFRGLDPYSRQADSMILDLMHHCRIDVVENDDKSINVRKSVINPFFFDIVDSPDLFAPLFILALCAEGESVIAGIRRLHNKESDRVKTFVEEFRKLGAVIHTSNDEMLVFGHEYPYLKGAKCSSHGDHRLAMALKVAGLVTRGKVAIDDVSCIDKSFPDFLEQFEKLRRNK